MSHFRNFLRLYRKSSPLTQQDIAFLVDNLNVENISRYEKSQRPPSIAVLFTYHLLFNTSIESLFQPQSAFIQSQLCDRLGKLISDLKNSNDPKNIPRIDFLQEVLIRLNG